MNREFVLRDNEIAINRPDGTVVIMNLEAYKALRDEKPNAEYQKTIDNLRNLLAKRDDQLKNAKTIQAGYEFQTEELQKQLDKAKEEKKALAAKVKFLEDSNKLLREAESIERQKRIEAEHKVSQAKPVNNMVLWGSTKVPKNIPDYVYVTSNGEVFFFATEIEKKYNLSKNSISAYFADKQKFLYPRDCNGVRPIDPMTGDFEHLGVVRRFTNNMFRDKNLNVPDFSYINASIDCAKKYRDGDL